ncbi:hypothetical protein M9H77_27672 [Catharanthus roseus]|uniref:Uncharacterized protein n=1 Tax=Catharanthus roseus TaxID=4058 RepID=A0ACC0AE11_CATRO|nr:hypothetical protein M9H77_27672 [Catharanthus roseus]
MGFKSKIPHRKPLIFSLFILSFTLILIVLYIKCLQCENPRKPLRHLVDHQTQYPKWYQEIIANEIGERRARIGLVNIDIEKNRENIGFIVEGDEAEIVKINFEPVADHIQWNDLFPDWINEANPIEQKCPEIPMPQGFEDYGEFDVIVAKVPRSGRIMMETNRDVFRLQVNLIVANMLVGNSRNIEDNIMAMKKKFVVFMGNNNCGPMWEIFRCDDLLWNEGIWSIYKPDLRRLKHKLMMPVGSCKIAPPFAESGQEGWRRYALNMSLYQPKEAYVTVLHSSEAYVCGAIALAQSLIKSNTTKDLILLADDHISQNSLKVLVESGWKIKKIKRIRSSNAPKNAYNEWNYSKLRIWQLTEYDKVMFIDSDLLVLRNLDEFFLYPQISAVWNDGFLFNSGLMLIEPSECTFKKLMSKRFKVASYNGGDQGFLNEVFTWWHRWPARLNFLKFFSNESDTEHKIPGDLYAIHYLGLKPWMCYKDYDCNWDIQWYQKFASDFAHEKWWQIYESMPKKSRPFCDLTPKMDARIKKWRANAGNENLADGHWKIKPFNSNSIPQMVSTNSERVSRKKSKNWLGEVDIVKVNFEPVADHIQWSDLFPRWINEANSLEQNCPEIPMPRFEDYGEFDVIVAKVPCSGLMENRDVFRLQVNLIAANMLARSSWWKKKYAVFMGSCGPMWEIFRCDDLLWSEGIWSIYRPDLRRLKQKLLMPVGACKLAPPLAEISGQEGWPRYALDVSLNQPREAYVTILHSSEEYVCGAIALAQSIIKSNTTKDLVLLVDDHISAKSLQGLIEAGWKVKKIKRIRSSYARKDAYNKWNYSKLRIWQLTEYDKVMFIDSDILVLRNLDEFFLYPQISAVWNDGHLFNSGLMLIEPSECTFRKLMLKRFKVGSYNGGDQGFLNEVFTWWHRWPARLNFLKFFGNQSDNFQHKIPGNLYAIHYLGLKPWICYQDYDCNWDIPRYQDFASDFAHEKWWQIYGSMPKKLRPFCDLTPKMDARIKKWRVKAEKFNLPNRHWKIKVKDRRRHL